MRDCLDVVPMVHALLSPSLMSHAAVPRPGATQGVYMQGVSPTGSGAGALLLVIAACGHTSHAQKVEYILGGFADSGGAPREGSNAPLCSTEGRQRPGFASRWGTEQAGLKPPTVAHEFMATKRGVSKMLNMALFSLEKA